MRHVRERAHRLDGSNGAVFAAAVAASGATIARAADGGVDFLYLASARLIIYSVACTSA